MHSLLCSINQNLEALAKQLYDYWFVQFDFPDENGKPYKSSGGVMAWSDELRREIPAGWNVVQLGSLIESNRGISYNTSTISGGGVPMLNLASFNVDGTYKHKGLKSYNGEYSADKVLKPFDLVMCNTQQTAIDEAKDIIGKAFLVPNIFDGDIVSSHHVTTLKCENKLKPYLAYLSNTRHFHKYATGCCSGTNIMGLDFCGIERYRMELPPKPLIQRFYDIAIAVEEEKCKAILENERLILLRDELLPLLMNGQVSLNSDLSNSVYIIYGLRLSVFMKENIIMAVITAMQRDLDCRQMARLKAVLIKELQDVEVSECKGTEQQRMDGNNDLLDAFISAKKIEGCSDKTLSYYRSTIERFLLVVNVAVFHVTTSDIRQYLSQYQEKNHSSKVTIDNMRRIFSSFFAWLEDEDYIAKSPVRRIHKVKTDTLVKEVLTDEQLEQLRDNCTNRRDLAIIDILASTGIRVGELVKLNRADIDFHERQCVVFGKGNKERMVYFNARTKLHLQQYLAERTDDNPALFVSLSSPHNRLTISGVEACIRKMGKRLDIPKVHPHKFRRTLATMAIDKGMPIEQVQRLLGHVRIDTTLHYAIVNQNNVKLAHKKYLG